MKYIYLFLSSLILTSCGSAYIANQVEKEFKGEWVLESVAYPNSSGFFDVELYDLADVNCFENSTWEFIPNNSTGKFILDGNACAKTENRFTWYIDPLTAKDAYPEVLMKITNGKKAKNVSTGTRIKITNLIGNKMTWEQNTMFKGEQITIEMNFTKL
ncbi:lipocalin family protein [Psychroflexus tropicus]|uniref:lipocalin family protein n=1 Tax=Psychroflexus tropicus TaxID=197345 RepID=UPI00037F5211|nr:lipocalin family protein [Psychroflexus tropicus]